MTHEQKPAVRGPLTALELERFERGASSGYMAGRASAGVALNLNSALVAAMKRVEKAEATVAQFKAVKHYECVPKEEADALRKRAEDAEREVDSLELKLQYFEDTVCAEGLIQRPGIDMQKAIEFKKISEVIKNRDSLRAQLEQVTQQLNLELSERKNRVEPLRERLKALTEALKNIEPKDRVENAPGGTMQDGWNIAAQFARNALASHGWREEDGG